MSGLSNTWFVDLTGTHGTGSGNTFNNRCNSFGGFVALPGDTVKVMESGAAVSIGSATWTNNSPIVTLSSPLTTTIATCDTAWTANSTNMTAGLAGGAFAKQGSNAAILSNSGATPSNTTLAYFNTGTIVLSGRTSITFWLASSLTWSTAPVSLRLCGAVNGASPLVTVALPKIVSANAWTPITVNFSSFSGTIKSISLFNITTAVYSLYLDNIEVTNSTGISLNTLISKNNGTDTWYAVKSIFGTQVELDSCPNLSTTSPPLGLDSLNGGFAGSTQTITTYVKKTINMATLGLATATIFWPGSISAPITVSGGWDTASMSTQTSDTWMDMQTGKNPCLNVAADYINLTSLYQTRGSIGLQLVGTPIGFTGAISANNCNSNLYLDGDQINVSILSCAGGLQPIGTQASLSFPTGDTINNISSISNFYSNLCGLSTNRGVVNIQGTLNPSNISGSTLNLTSGGHIENVVVTNSPAGLIQNFSELVIDSYSMINTTLVSNFGLVVKPFSKLTLFSMTTSGNTTAGVDFVDGGTQGTCIIYNASVGEPIPALYTTSQGRNSRLSFQNYQGILNNNITYTDGGMIVTDFTDPPSGQILDYRISVTSPSRTSLYPIPLSLAQIAVNANKLVLIQVAAKMSNITNISGNLVIHGNQVSGIPSDIVVPISAFSSAYNTYFVEFTPLTTGVVELMLYTWSDTGSVVDYIEIANISAAQA